MGRKKIPKNEATEKLLNSIKADTNKGYKNLIARTTAEKLLQTLYRQGLLKLELRDLKSYLDNYFGEGG